ncbi:restriction endonuclease subunit S [Psychromonas antarctica]|uniref:restriction endonuclease subunit S n=1 Tax=Psychromonas antarctica TaxID=67573 RepID=UPI001EE8D9F1|nr:restriction endonuclease subunit S [Psychromonas antarctica]MCG6200035.1 restriction endonuclease subunit S [Psychromonas antarctica]
MTNLSGVPFPSKKVNVASDGPQGGGMDSRRNQISSKQLIPDGYKQTEVGVIPDEWDAISIGDTATLIGDGIHSTPVYDSNGNYYFVNGNNINNGSIKLTENTKRVNESEYQKHKKNINNRTLFLSINGTIGNLCFYNNEPIILGKSAAYINIRNTADVQYMYHALSCEATQQRFEDGLTGSTIQNLGLGTIKSTLIPFPKLKEQTAIANALSDVDLLLSELEKLIAKKQAIKTATMQQLLTGKTRLPQFAYVNSDESTEGELKNKAIHQTSSPTSNQTTGTTPSQGKKKGTKPSELGEIPKDWEVVAFGDLFEQTIHRKKLHPDVLTTFVGMQDVSENAQLVTQKQVPFYKISSGFTYFEKGDVLVAKITPCFENGKGSQTHILETKIGFGSTEFHILRAKNLADSNFIYFWTIRDCLRKELAGEMVGSAGHRRVPFLAIQNYQIPCPPSKEEQIAIATILSDMDEEIQALSKRLSKTRQIKQGMMQELLTGRTRLPVCTEAK